MSNDKNNGHHPINENRAGISETDREQNNKINGRGKNAENSLNPNSLNSGSNKAKKEKAKKEKPKPKDKKKPSTVKITKLYLLIILGIALLLAFITYAEWLANYENVAYDALSQLGIVAPFDRLKQTSLDIYIVGITDECLSELGSWPWRRDTHARLLEFLTMSETSVVGMDMFFVEPSAYPEADRALAEATAAGVPVVSSLAANLDDTVRHYHEASLLRFPYDELDAAAPAGFINVIADRDGILRKALIALKYEDRFIPSFDLLVWGIHQGYSADEIAEIIRTGLSGGVPGKISIDDLNIPFEPHSTQMMVNYQGKPGTFTMLPYHRVLNGDYRPSTFKDKIILVGYFTMGLGDYYFTPLEKETPMFGVEHHANAINTFLNNNAISFLPWWFSTVLVVAISLSGMLLFIKMRLLWSSLTFISCTVFLLITSLTLLLRYNIYMETVYPMVALLVAFLTATGYSYVDEMRERQRVTGIFGRYVAQQVVDEILQVGEENLKLGGVRRKISILFIDIRGFTPLSEKLTPEQVVGVLNEYFQIVTQCIFENKGTVDKFMGDAVMALYNAPVFLEDHEYWAVKTGEAILTHGAELQKKVMDMCGVTLNFGIGINSGDAVVGNIGSDTRMEYTAIGDAVNLAARLESNSKAGQVLVSETVYEAVKDKLPMETMGEISVKGKSKPVKIYQLKK